MNQLISKQQLAAIHTLFAQYARQRLDLSNGNDRHSRIAWISKACGRSVTTSKELSSSEAATVIGELKAALGDDQANFTRRPRSREAAQAAGTHGRRQTESNEIVMASPVDHERIQHAIERLGWSHEHYESWLRSATSPLSNVHDPRILTLAQANRVWWALKNMLKQSRRWNAA